MTKAKKIYQEKKIFSYSPSRVHEKVIDKSERGKENILHKFQILFIINTAKIQFTHA
jgi:hypothetical protein